MSFELTREDEKLIEAAHEVLRKVYCDNALRVIPGLE